VSWARTSSSGASAMARSSGRAKSLAMTAGRLDQPLGLGGQAVDARGEYGLHS